MKLKLDENIPHDLLPEVARLGHDVDTVESEGLQGQPDDTIWQAAQSESRFLITQDLDFADIVRHPPGTHAGILVLRLGDASRRALNARLGDPGHESLLGQSCVKQETQHHWSIMYLMAWLTNQARCQVSSGSGVL